LDTDHARAKAFKAVTVVPVTIVPDPGLDGKKCGNPGDSGRLFRLEHGYAKESSCTSMCSTTPGCVAYSAQFGHWCIGCDRPLDTDDARATAFKAPNGGVVLSSSHGDGVLLLASTLLTERLGDFSSGQQVGSLANMDQADYRIGKTGADINKMNCQKIRWETQSGRKKEWAGPFDFSKMDSISRGCNSASRSQIKSGLWWHAGGSGCYGSKHFGLSTTSDVHSYCSSNGAKHWGHFHRGGVNTGIYMWENDCFNEHEGQERFYLYCVGGSA